MLNSKNIFEIPIKDYLIYPSVHGYWHRLEKTADHSAVNCLFVGVEYNPPVLYEDLPQYCLKKGKEFHKASTVF